MRAFQTRGCLQAAIRTIIFTEFLLTSVRGDGADPEDTLDIKYVLIGGGIGLFLVALFILTKFCIIRNQASQNNTDINMRRVSEARLPSLSHVSQSERSDAAPSSDV